MENVFWPLSITDPKEIRKRFAKLLVNERKKVADIFLNELRFLCDPMMVKVKELGLDDEDILIPSMGQLKQWNSKFDIVGLKGKITSPFLTDAIDYWRSINTKKSEEKWVRYFSSLLLELYEFRNAQLHAGKVNRFSQIKLKDVLPEIMNTGRRKLIYSCRENPNMTYVELLSLLA